MSVIIDTISGAIIFFMAVIFGWMMWEAIKAINRNRREALLVAAWIVGFWLFGWMLRHIGF